MHHTKRTKITNEIEYIEPDSNQNFLSCAGIIVNSKPKVLIDTNIGKSDTLELLQSEKPDIYIITHHHGDHTSWVYHVLEYRKAEIYIPRGEEEYFYNVDHLVNKTVGEYPLGFSWKDLTIHYFNYKEIQAYSSYDESLELDCSSVKIKCIDTPGHSPSHKSFYFPDEKIIFTGDLGIDKFGPWYGWANCDLKLYIESLLKINSYEADVIATSHGGVLKNESDAFLNCVKIIFNREESIIKRLDEGRSKSEIVSEGIYYFNKSRAPEHFKSFYIMWDDFMFEHHMKIIADGGLNKLFKNLA